MARKKRDFDEVEVEEIIKLRLSEINGLIDKLSYNGVSKLNKRIANNSEFKRQNGQLFKLYPYDFWGGTYKGNDNYGKCRIDDIKANKKLELFSDVFDSNLKDVILAVNDLHKNPVKLTKILTNIYEKDKRKVEKLDQEVKLLKDQNKNLVETLDMMQNVMYTLFYCSQSSKNSLTNMLNLKCSEDSFVFSQIEKAFYGQEELIQLLKENPKKQEGKNVIELKNNNRRKKLDNLGI